jgi:hypothetical protein
MIHESKYWKQPLLRAATWLERASLVDDDDQREKLFAKIEREVFVGFYAIRKLLPTFKLSLATKRLKFELVRFTAKVPASKIDYFNRHEIDDFYDLDRSDSEEKDLRFICNLIVHSYVFIIEVGEHRSIAGFYVSSDQSTAMGKLYFLGRDQVVQAFRMVGRDYPKNLRLERDQDTDQWIQLT